MNLENNSEKIDTENRKIFTAKRQFPTFIVSKDNRGVRQPRSAQLKVEIDTLAENNSIHKASKEFKADRKCIREYIRNQHKLIDLAQFLGN
jgi:hypothetical protein